MRFIIIWLLLLLLASPQIHSQTPNPATVNVNELSDEQIARLVSEMEKRGLSENDAINMARARGMSQSQIDQLKRRIEANKQKGFSNHTKVSGYGNVADGKSSSEVLSSKVKIDSSKVDQRIFGFSLFNNDKLTFEPTVNIPVSQGYILGAGDQLVIDVWGLSQQTYELTIDRNGTIQIPLLGPIAVGGMTLGEATSLIRNQLASIYSDLKSNSPRTYMAVRTGVLKPIRVNVIGRLLCLELIPCLEQPLCSMCFTCRAALPKTALSATFNSSVPAKLFRT